MDHPENSKEYVGLQVNQGVAQPSIINPYLKRSRFQRRELSVAEMVEGIVKGDVTVLSQAVTLVESVNPDHQQKAQEVIDKCLPYSGKSIRIGISGVPGAGKSTSIDEFGVHVLDRTGGKLAVLATADAINTMNLKEKARRAEEAANRQAAVEMGGKLKNVTVKLTAKGGKEGKLFGAITSKEISEGLASQYQLDVPKQKIVLDEPIKAFGTYEVKAKLGFEVSGVVKVTVTEA